MLDGTPALARKPLSPTITATLALGAALAAAALVVQYRKQKAEKENPPQGAFIGVGGCQASLHRGGAG